MNLSEKPQSRFEPFTDYQQTIDFLYSRLPIFTRVGSSAYKADLSNTIALTSALGNPQNSFKSIHIAGTNGKGSSSHMLAAILQQAGYKTGLYTSPHLKDFRERIRINGEMISTESVISFVNQQRENIEKISPSFFEMTVAMAFDYFRNEKVDIAVIETGLGGRLDSTNIIEPEVCLITNIGYDHMNILGSSLQEIAAEKAGIIKAGVPVVLSQKQDEILQVFSEKAASVDAPLVLAAEQWQTVVEPAPGSEFLEIRAKRINSTGDDLQLALDLKGLYQAYNLGGVLSTVDILVQKGYSIGRDEVRSALKRVQSLTGLMGRWQVLQTHPTVVCDTGHNADGIAEILRNVANTPHQRLHWVIGMVNDKDISSILRLLPNEASYYFCAPDMPRARQADELRADALKAGLNGDSYSSVNEAFRAAISEASDKDLVLVAGSTFVVAEVL